MKRHRHLNTDYDAWLRRKQSRTVEEILQKHFRYERYNSMQ